MADTVTLGPGESTPVSFQVTPTVAKVYTVKVNGLVGSFQAAQGHSAAHLRMSYHSKYPNWEFLTAVKGIFGGLLTMGDPRNTWLVLEGEYGNAECEPYVRISGNTWRVGIAVRQATQGEVEINPQYYYEYLIEVTEPGKIHYVVTRLIDGTQVFEWAGPHGGAPAHSYFSEYSTSLECQFVNGCTSLHEANHFVYFAYDSKLQIWIDAAVAFTMDAGEEEKQVVCTGIIPNATAYMKHLKTATLYQDYCKITYG